MVFIINKVKMQYEPKKDPKKKDEKKKEEKPKK